MEREIDGKISVYVKPGAKKTELRWDDERDMWVLSVQEPAQDNKANAAVIKFFTKLTKKKVSIISGMKNKTKILQIS